MGFVAFVVGKSTDEHLKNNFLRLMAEDIAREKKRVVYHINYKHCQRHNGPRVLTCQPESHQLSLQNLLESLSDGLTSGPINRTPGTSGSDKNDRRNLVDIWNIYDEMIIDICYSISINQHLVTSIALILFKRLRVTHVTSIASMDWVKIWESSTVSNSTASL